MSTSSVSRIIAETVLMPAMDPKVLAEVKALEADRYRLPWRDGVPAVIEASLKPYRERLEAGYSRMANLFEIAVDQRWGSRGRANN